MDFLFPVILIIFILERIFNYILDLLNLSYMKEKSASIPVEFEGIINNEDLNKTQHYEITKTGFGIFSGIFSDILLILFVFTGILNFYNSWIMSFQFNFIISGIIFFILIVYSQSILNIPFDLYNTFRIENRFGFNTMNAGLWLSDFIKSILIETVLLCFLLGAGLWIVKISPDLWWFWLWLFFFAFSLFMMYISPYVIEPLFNKYSPIEKEELEVKIKELLAKTGIKVSHVFKMDASKRSKHTNAYFSGIGKVKRIILFDTLIQSLTTGEILSVLAHEAGHWKKKHILKTIIIYESISFIIFYLSYRILNTNWLTEIFKINNGNIFVKFILLGVLLNLASFIFAPLISGFSRKNEREADDFAFKLTGNGINLAGALKKLSRDNMSNIYPHPLYVIFHYSHPPIIERIRRLEKYAENKEEEH